MRSRPMHKHLTYTWYAWLLFLAMPLHLLANEQPEALLKKGNAAYAKAQYTAAAAAYQQVLEGGYEAVPLYFNLANAYYKLGEIPSAILYYEKARKLAPGDVDIQLNLKLANLKITDRIEALPEFFLDTWWKAFILFFSVKTLSVFNVICCSLGFSFLIVYLFLTPVLLKKLAFYTAIVILSLGLISLIMVNVQSSYLNGHQHGIVFSGAADVRTGPDPKQKTLFVIHAGTRVTIKESSNGWIRVELPNGNSGWIAASDVKEI
jgi:tetratricopeptide (TPR) repeat protein